MCIEKFTVLALVSLMTACSTNADLLNVPDKETSSLALQVTRSAGSMDSFVDKHLAVSALNDVTAAGYVGQTALGMMFTTGVQGFLTALISDQQNGWQWTNYITFLDAEQVEGFDVSQVSQILIQKMDELYPISLEKANALATNATIKATDRVYRDRYNGGTRLVVSGYQVGSKEDAPACLRFSRDQCVIGGQVVVRTISKPIDTSIFSDELIRMMPSDSVVAVRYHYANIMTISVAMNAVESGYGVTTQYFPSSPSLRLPDHTFLSMPEKVLVDTTKGIDYPSGVRNNDSFYFFVSPVDGQQFKMPLADFHQRETAVVEGYQPEKDL